MRVCVNRNRGRHCFLFCKGPILNDIRGRSDPKNMPDCRKSHLIFQNFVGRPPDPPPALGSGLRPLTAPLSKIPGSAPGRDRPTDYALIFIATFIAVVAH